MISSMKALFVRIPSKLWNRVEKAARLNDLKFSAVVKQALELWLKENRE